MLKKDCLNRLMCASVRLQMITFINEEDVCWEAWYLVRVYLCSVNIKDII